MNTTRRITIVLILLTVLLVSGCAPAKTAEPTLTPVPTLAPTATLAPTTAPTATDVPPTVEAIPASWNEIPVMPGALTAGEKWGDFQFTTAAAPAEIVAWYGQEMPKLGWTLQPDMMASIPTDLAFSKGTLFMFFKIEPAGADNLVTIHPFQQ